MWPFTSLLSSISDDVSDVATAKMTFVLAISQSISLAPCLQYSVTVSVWGARLASVPPLQLQVYIEQN